LHTVPWTSWPGRPDGRIALARVFKTDEQKWPSALQGQGIGFWFYDRTESEPWPWGWQFDWRGAAPNEDVSKELMKMASVLRRRLMEIEEELDRRAAQQKEIAVLKSGQAKEIYLHARQQDRELWDRTSTELIDVGIEVRPGQPEPDDAEENDRIRSNLARIASRCEAMLLVGADPYRGAAVGGHRRPPLRRRRHSPE
jgi:hypothetical protein